MKKNILLLLFILPFSLLSQTPYNFNGSYSLNSNTSFPGALGLGTGNCGNGASQTIIINGDLNLNGKTLELRNVALIIYGNLNGGGSVITCSNNSTICVSGAIQNNPNINVTRNTDCAIPPCTKTWLGSQSTNWYNGSNWSPSGIPTIDCDVIINNSNACVISTTNAEAKTITLTNSANLTINSEGVVKVKGKVDIASTATFVIENNSSLIQIDNIANSGNITKKRSTTITKMDYVYWSSPVENFNASNVSPNSSAIYKWIPTISTNTNGFGSWAGATNETMVKGKGYIVRGPNNFSANTTQLFTATFTGKPNNGNITIPITRGTYSGQNYTTSSGIATEDDDNWNLIGNPYPSAIDITKFLQVNTDLDGYVHVWTHNTPIGNSNSPFYGSFAFNYSANDYIKMNATGASINGVKSLIGSGQGFFVKMSSTSNTTTSSVLFNNEMRGNNIANNQFYRTNSSERENDPLEEKHRIWLNLVNPNQLASSTLIGYVSNATNGVDRLYDAESKIKSSFELYSLIDTRFFNIQGKALPFNNTDEIPLGFTTNISGLHSFGLTAVDGLFDGSQDIYIQDLELGITHNLKETPYTFTTNSGKYDNRFVLKFNNETLSNDDFLVKNEIIVYTEDGIFIDAKNIIKEVSIYDVVGRLISKNNNINATNYRENQVIKSNVPLFVHVVLENNIKVVTKIIY